MFLPGVEVSVSKGLLARTIGAAFDRSYYFDPVIRRELDGRCHAYTNRELADLDAFFTESNLGRREHVDERQVLVGGIQPNLIQGMLLGAEFMPNPAGDADISPACWEGRSLDDLPSSEEQLDHELIRLFDRQIMEIQTEGRLTPIPPFFWDASGRAAVHGALTSTQKFLGEDVFVDMLIDPDRIHRMTEWIADSNIALVQHFAEICGVEVAEVHVGECSSCMIAPDQWDEFVVPTLNRMAEALGPVRLHSCGPSDHILEKARTVARLSSLDLGGETSVAKVRELFGSGFPVSIAPLAEDLAAGSPDALLAWLGRVLEENRDGNLTVLYHIEAEYDLGVLRAFHERIRDLTSERGASAAHRSCASRGVADVVP